MMFSSYVDAADKNATVENTEESRMLDEDRSSSEETTPSVLRRRMAWGGLLGIVGATVCFMFLHPSSPDALTQANTKHALALWSYDGDGGGSTVGWSASPPFEKYQGYTGDRSVYGSMTITTSDYTPYMQTFVYALSGVPSKDKCDAAGGVDRACQFRVVTATSCTTEPGTDLYGSLPANPWDGSAQYQYADGASSTVTDAAGTLELTTGLKAGEIDQHAMIVYDETGAPIACTLVKHEFSDPTDWSTEDGSAGIAAVGYSDSPAFVPYTGYVGSYAVDGTMIIATNSEAPYIQSVLYQLSGLPTKEACDTPEAKLITNACEFHIHTGMNCYDDAGGHYYAADLPADPYIGKTRYYNDGGSNSAGLASGEAAITTGLKADDINGRTMIVHDEAGQRIACSIVQHVVSTHCLPGDASVELHDGSRVSMKSLSAGDRVLAEHPSGDLVHEPVIVFLHELHSTPTNMDLSQFVFQAS
jgi:hypothetical protein